MSEIDLSQAEYAALRATIRERGTVRLVIAGLGLAAWGALTTALVFAELAGAVVLVPLVVLAATFEINFFIHTGVERIGRYLQVFYEERASWTGWETTAMNYGTTFPGRGLDPLFSIVFFCAALVDFVAPIVIGTSPPGWIAVSLVTHLAFNYRIVRARLVSATQRAIELEQFRGLARAK